LAVADPPIDTGGFAVAMTWIAGSVGDLTHRWRREPLIAMAASAHASRPILT